MNQQLREWLSLTATERNVGLFIIGTFVLGLGVRFYQTTYASQEDFNYRESDSTFAARSVNLDDQPSHRKTPPGTLNINLATKKELMSLPGIGAVTADRIIAHREASGSFKKVEELQRIKGISKKKLDKLRSLIVVN